LPRAPERSSNTCNRYSDDGPEETASDGRLLGWIVTPFPEQQSGDGRVALSASSITEINDRTRNHMTGTVLIIFGTRPEAIKLAPLVREIEKRGRNKIAICVTGQHREMLDQVLNVFEFKPDFDLDLMRTDQTLTDVTVGTLTGVERVIKEVHPAMVVVQGDTTTAMAGALAAYYAQTPIAHVEAGLRTGQKYSPFPEEINRAVVDVMADLHFPPTETARQNLLRSGITDDSITVTGNTAIDAVMMMARQTQHFGLENSILRDIPADLAEAVTGTAPIHRLVLVTGHRRESFGDDLESICRALLKISEEHEDVEIAYPVHLNPRVRETVSRLLGNSERIRLFEPPAYPAFVWLLQRAHLVITDSGGIQEEAPALDKPVLITRRVTERPEGVEAGCARLVGVDMDDIVMAAEELLTDDVQYQKMANAPNPFGDGHASELIASAIENWLTLNE